MNDSDYEKYVERIVALDIYDVVVVPKGTELVVYKITSNDKRPLIISTSSKQLQDEIQNNYLPDISKMLLEGGIISKKITSVLRKGKSNYICDERLQSYTENVTRGNKSLEELIALKNLIISGRIVLGEVEVISPYDKRKINVLPELCYTCRKIKHVGIKSF